MDIEALCYQAPGRGGIVCISGDVISGDCRWSEFRDNIPPKCLEVRCMTKIIRFRLLGLLFCGLALAAAYNKTRTEAAMLDIASRFLDSLTPEQRAGTQLDFDGKDRTMWHYFPERGFKDEYKRDRHGIMFKEMNITQRFLAQALLSSGLSQAGFIKAMKVMTMEDIVRVMENDTTGHRDAERYHFAIFGKPAATGVWGWRVEGHHLSLNFVIRNGRMVSSTPTFFGGNPHEASEGPLKGLRALEREEDLGMTLVNSLDPKQRKQAIFSDIAPYDIITMATVRAKLEGDPQGLPASKMNDRQMDTLMNLIAEYADNMPPEIAAERMKAVRETPRTRPLFRLGRRDFKEAAAARDQGECHHGKPRRKR